MARMYVPSTPATRGEAEAQDEVVPVLASQLSPEQLESAAKAAGYELTPIRVAEPAGNASREAWVTYAKAQGASDEDLVDEDGQELGRDAIRDKYQAESEA